MNTHEKQIVASTEPDRDGKPRCESTDLEHDSKIGMTDGEKIDLAAARILKKYRKAFEELAK